MEVLQLNLIKISLLKDWVSNQKKHKDRHKLKQFLLKVKFSKSLSNNSQAKDFHLWFLLSQKRVLIFKNSVQKEDNNLKSRRTLQ